METGLETRSQSQPQRFEALKVPVITKESIKEYLTKGNFEMSDGKMNEFINVAVENGLNPYKREVYAVPFYNSKTRKMDIQPITSYTVYLARANMTGMLDGWETKIMYDDNKNVVGGLIQIYRKDRTRPFIWNVLWNEIVQKKKDGTPNNQRKTKPEFMTRKVLISQGMRLCFPEYLSGMPYEEDELPRAEIIQQKPQPQPKTKPKQQAQAQAPVPVPTVIEGKTTEIEKDESIDDLVGDFASSKNGTEIVPEVELLSSGQLTLVQILGKKTGFPPKEIKQLMMNNYEIDSSKKLTKDQAISFIGELKEIIEFQFTSDIIKLTKKDIEITWNNVAEKGKREILLKHLEITEM